MPKVHAPCEFEKPPAPFRPWQAVRVLVILAAVGPFLFEGGKLCYARWARLLGSRVPVRTPVLDQAGHLFRSTRGALMAQFRSVPWSPQIVLVVGILSCTACMYLLRGKGSRVE